MQAGELSVERTGFLIAATAAGGTIPQRATDKGARVCLYGLSRTCTLFLFSSVLRGSYMIP